MEFGAHPVRFATQLVGKSHHRAGILQLRQRSTSTQEHEMTTAYDKNEIDDFKRMDIRTFLPSLGWQPDPTDRYKKTTYTKDGRTVKAFCPSSGFWIATDFDAKVSKTAFDLAFEILGDKNWPEACALFRSITGKDSNPSAFKPSPAPSSTPLTSSTSQDRSAPVPQASPDQSNAKIKKTTDEIKAEYVSGSSLWRRGDPVPDYLVSRGIVMLDDRFDATFRVSDSGSGNLRFPHYYMSDSGHTRLGGIEGRGPSKKGMYSERGVNGIWKTRGWSDTGMVVIFETQIDAMSYSLLNPKGHMLMSIRAGTEHIAVQFLKIFIEMNKIHTVVVSTDNDAAGLGYAARILGGLYAKEDERNPEHGTKYHCGARALYQPPLEGHEDWNDVLRAALSASPDEMKDSSPSP